jgi:hypothetical protein
LNCKAPLTPWAAATILFLLAGCASTPSTDTTDARYDPNKPQIFLANARVEHVKGLAMGAAATKGWSLAEVGDDTLLLTRPLNAAAAESIAPGASLTPQPPRVEVRAVFFPRLGGVDVMLDAEVLLFQGGDKEKREGFTDSYRPELMRSLAELRAAWSESRALVADAVPPLPDTPAAGLDALASGDDGAPAEGEEATAGERIAAPAGPAPIPAAAPVETRDARPEPAPSPQTPAGDAGASPDNMLVLRQPRQVGLWAYYAEQYARLRGCSLAGDGAVLIEKSRYGETHRVYCEGGGSYLVRCNAADCRGMR